MIFIILIILGVLYFSAILFSTHFRNVANVAWDLYFLHVLKLAWPYVLIFAVYEGITNGSLANFIRTAFFTH
jgi:hypothetical protein